MTDTHDAVKTAPDALAQLVNGFVDDDQSALSIGVLGAIAEFERAPGEPADRLPGGIVTPRGAVALAAGASAHVVAYEVCVGRGHPGWSQALALCLPAAEADIGAHQVITELGPDHNALRAADRDAPLFDLGLGHDHLRACVRSADPTVLTVLRRFAGQPFHLAAPMLAPALVQASPHRVFLSRLARIEVYQPIPPADGATPRGPHTHLLPRLMVAARPHSANLPLPAGWRACLEIHPRPALRTGARAADEAPDAPDAPDAANAPDTPARFDRSAYLQFQPWLERHGEPALLEWKRLVMAQVRNGDSPDGHRHRGQPRVFNMTRRVALRQLAQLDGPSPTLQAWRKAFD